MNIDRLFVVERYTNVSHKLLLAAYARHAIIDDVFIIVLLQRIITWTILLYSITVRRWVFFLKQFVLSTSANPNRSVSDKFCFPRVGIGIQQVKFGPRDPINLHSVAVPIIYYCVRTPRIEADEPELFFRFLTVYFFFLSTK